MTTAELLTLLIEGNVELPSFISNTIPFIELGAGVLVSYFTYKDVARAGVPSSFDRATPAKWGATTAITAGCGLKLITLGKWQGAVRYNYRHYGHLTSKSQSINQDLVNGVSIGFSNHNLLFSISRELS